MEIQRIFSLPISPFHPCSEELIKSSYINRAHTVLHDLRPCIVRGRRHLAFIAGHKACLLSSTGIINPRPHSLSARISPPPVSLPCPCRSQGIPWPTMVPSPPYFQRLALLDLSRANSSALTRRFHQWALALGARYRGECALYDIVPYTVWDVAMGTSINSLGGRGLICGLNGRVGPHQWCSGFLLT